MDLELVEQLEQEVNGLKVDDSDDQLIIGLDFGTTYRSSAVPSLACYSWLIDTVAWLIPLPTPPMWIW